MRIKQLILCLLIVGLGWTWSGPAQATLIDLHFTGHITTSDLVDPELAAGDFIGDFIYDSSTPNLPSDPSIGEYAGISLEMSFSSGATGKTSAGKPSIFVENNFGGADTFEIGDQNFAVTGASYHLTVASLILVDSSQTVFSTTALPASLSLSDFNSRMFMLVDEDSGNSLVGIIDTMTFRPVPLPASILLFGTALAGWLVAGTIRRNKR